MVSTAFWRMDMLLRESFEGSRWRLGEENGPARARDNPRAGFALPVLTA